MEVIPIRAIPSGVEVSAAQDGRYTFKGIASTIGDADRMRRVFLPGAFGQSSFKVPLFYLHDEHKTIGSSVLTPRGGHLYHESSINPSATAAGEVRDLIQGGDMPATSIGWLSQQTYMGWTQLKRQAPELAQQAATLGVPQGEDIVYYADAEVLENSVVPIPANRNALISMASLLSKEKGMLEGMLELAAGARHSSTDQAAIQRAHDALKEVGAQCADTEPLAPGAPEPGSNLDGTGITGGWKEHMRSALESIQSGQDAQQMIQTASYALSLLDKAEKAAVVPDDDDGGDDPGKLAQAIDQALDDAFEDHAAGNDDMAWQLVTAAATACDKLLMVLNVPDSDESGEIEQARLRSRRLQEQAAAQPDGGDPQSTPPVTNYEIEALDRELAALIQS